MGVKDLQKTIQENTKSAVRETTTKDYVGRRIAIDSSILLYQFITTITAPDGEPLKNQQGQVTSHLVGLLARCTRMAECGVKPIFVFDGKAFEQKEEELKRRQEVKEQNLEKANEAKQAGDIALYKKYAKRAVKVGTEQYGQAIKLLKLMGIHTIIADGEAEALCVALCRAGLCDAVASSDLDCLAYGAPVFVRNLGTDKPCVEITYERVLSQMELSPEQFTDLCIILGCDYVDRIRGIGPKTAVQLLREHKTIEKLLEARNNCGLEDVDGYLARVKGAREIFGRQGALTAEQIGRYRELLGRRVPMDLETAVSFLTNEMQFDGQGARKRLERYQRARAAPKQTSLSGFIRKIGE